MSVFIPILVLAAAGLLTWGVLGLVVRERTARLDQALAPYSLRRSAPSDAALAGSGTQDLVQSPILQRAIEAVALIATRRGLMPVVESKLNEADIPIRPAEAVFFWLVAVVVAAVIGGFGFGPIWGLVAAAVAIVVPFVVLDTMASRRTRAFADQLPDMLQLLSTTLRSGFSILQGLEAVSRQISDPIGKEMRGVVAEARLGRPLVSALVEVAHRLKSEDFEWVATAIGIQQEVGGNLAELLDIVSETMNARSRLRREAHALTAEGRIGALIISILPIAIGLFVYVVNPSYLTPLFHSGTGEILFYGSIGLAVIGILWLRRIIEIEV